MLTQDQRDTFRKALASYNFGGRAEVDIDDMLTDEQVVETRDTLEEFFNAHGWRNDRNGDRPAIPRELNKTAFGDIYIWEDVQARKGARRGNLYVMDFGDARACRFAGEV